MINYKVVNCCPSLLVMVCECIILLIGLTQNCIEQSFDSAPHISVSKNTVLCDNFAANIHSCLAAITTKLGKLLLVI